MENELEKLLMVFPDKSWNWTSISWNESLTMEIIEKYIDKPWDWTSISCNKGLTMEIIEKYIDKPWDWAHISQNINLSIDNIDKYIIMGELSLDGGLQPIKGALPISIQAGRSCLPMVTGLVK